MPGPNPRTAPVLIAVLGWPRDGPPEHPVAWR